MIDGLQRVDAGHSAKLETEHDGFVVLTSVTHVLANQHEIRSESSAERELGKGIKKKKISLGYELFPTDPLFLQSKRKGANNKTAARRSRVCLLGGKLHHCQAPIQLRTR